MSIHTMISLRPENVIRHLPWQFDSKAALGFLLLLATFSLVGWLYLTQASAVATTSYRIDELRVELDQLQQQNSALALEIAQLEALPRIERRAGELGFVPTTNVRYLTVSNYPIPDESPSVLSLESKLYHQAEPEPLSWWINTLDNLAAWITGEG